MDDQRQPTVEVETDPPDGDSPTPGAVTCELCDQRVDQHEAVTVAVGDAGRETMCAFCAGSLFDDLEVGTGTATGDPVEPADDADPVAPAERRDATGPASASAVSWEPERPRSSSGVLGTLLRAHYLSLSLLWAIHRTNVRLTERVLEEVDVQLLATLTVVLSAFVLAVLGLAAGLGGVVPAAG